MKEGFLIKATIMEFGGEVELKIQLDNLDWTEKITLDENLNLVVTNEHGTEFPASDLSTAELGLVMHELSQLDAKIPPKKSFNVRSVATDAESPEIGTVPNVRTMEGLTQGMQKALNDHFAAKVYFKFNKDIDMWDGRPWEEIEVLIDDNFSNRTEKIRISETWLYS